MMVPFLVSMAASSAKSVAVCSVEKKRFLNRCLFKSSFKNKQCSQLTLSSPLVTRKRGSVTVHLLFRSHALYSPLAHCNSKISKNAEHRAVSVCKITNAVHHKGPNLVVLISVHMVHFSRVDLDPLSEMSPRVGWNSYVYRAGLVQIML